MERTLRHESACILIIPSEEWFAAYNKKTDDKPGAGLGAAAEANIIRQWLYDNENKNTRIRLAFLHEIDAERVPPNLRAWQQFRPFNPDDQLRWVAGCLSMDNIEPPIVRPEPVETSPAPKLSSFALS